MVYNVHMYMWDALGLAKSLLYLAESVKGESFVLVFYKFLGMGECILFLEGSDLRKGS